jgi:hypothetical protein
MNEANILNLAAVMRDRIFWSTPYRTGNLARNGITDLKTLAYAFGHISAGFELFSNPYTQYGAILNECPTIKYVVHNPFTWKTYAGEYVNKHYMWVDKFAELWAGELPLYVPGLRRVA